MKKTLLTIEVPFSVGEHRFVPHQWYRPEHQNKARFLLKISDYHIGWSFRYEVRIGVKLYRLLFKDRRRIRPDNGNVGRMNDDDSDDQRKKLEDEFNGKLFSHRFS